jgi:hypothetical protein
MHQQADKFKAWPVKISGYGLTAGNPGAALDDAKRLVQDNLHFYFAVAYHDRSVLQSSRARFNHSRTQGHPIAWQQETR